jgi:glycosyltransferase involved in cell wall biosynthesis
MIKVKIYELDKHRNETTFRPYLMAQNVLREIGIEFTDGDSYDFAWIGQASFMNKKVSLKQSTEDGLEFLSKITGDYMLFDGQDSTSLIGSYDVFKESNALLLLKNSLLKDRFNYKTGFVNGRYYWGAGDYSCKDFDRYSEKIRLSGTNWLSTIRPQWRSGIPKIYDVSALFSYPSKTPVYEHELHQSAEYDKFRKPCIDVVNKLTCNVAKLEAGVKLPPQEYYTKMAQSKIVLAPLGYGEMAPRDVEAVMFGSILIKPDMSYIDSKPMWYEDGVTYIACKHNFSDLEEKIDYVLSNYDELQRTMIPKARRRFDELYTLENTALATYKIFKELEGVECE